MKTKKYLVGFVGYNQTSAYSKRAWRCDDDSGGVELMTFGQAKKELKTLHPGRGGKIAIYELVEVYKQ